ncbi:MAG: hypothetical protein ND895_13990, partial [Pyrinomonadaceae bacterium]|nr:hypothetical protein [Pyrinomonadaceae bacterium]
MAAINVKKAPVRRRGEGGRGDTATRLTRGRGDTGRGDTALPQPLRNAYGFPKRSTIGPRQAPPRWGGTASSQSPSSGKAEPFR